MSPSATRPVQPASNASSSVRRSKFERAAVIAVTGADMQPTLDGAALPMWESVAIDAGQTLCLGGSRMGARAYIAVAGGIANEPWLGSRSTFHKAGVGGIDGHALKDGQVVPVGTASGTPGRRIRKDARPPISASPPAPHRGGGRSK